MRRGGLGTTHKVDTLYHTFDRQRSGVFEIDFRMALYDSQGKLAAMSTLVDRKTVLMFEGLMRGGLYTLRFPEDGAFIGAALAPRPLELVARELPKT